MSNVFVRYADGSDLTDSTISFAQNDAGDTLIAVFAMVSTTGDVTLGAGPYIDTNGNPWDLLYSSLNNAGGVSGLFNSVAVLKVDRCASIIGNNDLNSPLSAGDMVAQWCAGFEWSTPFSTFAFDNALYLASNAAAHVFNATQSGDNDLVIAAFIDAGLNNSSGGQGMSYIPGSNVEALDAETGTTNPGSSVIGSGTETVDSYAVHANLNSATDTFGFVVSMSGNAVPSVPPTGNFVFSISKGPLPKPLAEGRAIVTAQIDLTQLLVQPITDIGIDLPEFVYSGNLGAGGSLTPYWQYYIQREFDLEHLFQGSGLSEVRSLIAYSRPLYGWVTDQNNNIVRNEFNSDTNGDNNKYQSIALLTNTTTLQTTVLGGSAMSEWDALDGPSIQTEVQQIAFPANKGGLRFRLLALFTGNQEGTGMGRYTLNFCNFELPSSFISNGLWVGHVH